MIGTEQKDSGSVPDNVLVRHPSRAEELARIPTHVRGGRLEHLFEAVCDRSRHLRAEAGLAVDADDVRLSYEQLDARANRLARHLVENGVRPGDRIALLLDDAVHAYTAMLGVLKARGAYVPLDPSFPADRIAYIVGDADVSRVLTLSHLEALLPDVAADCMCLDRDQQRIDRQECGRITGGNSTRGGDDDLAYIIYTSGSTGRPKGVAIEHASICNFVSVAADVYGLEPHHRVYQGMTIAFDFSVEEIWVPWMVGATLVPKPRGTTLLGAELADFLVERRVTAMCCVPTLLSTLEEDLPDLSFLLVSGEACPRDLIARWHRPGRRFLNVYGPTEATVTATMAVAHPERTVTLGCPLPSYAAVILDPEQARDLPRGELGEIGLAGIGLARGYVNRDDLTAKAFIPDFLNLPGNPSGRIYRTGDLGRINDDGEIEYHGRIDTQVKVRGYRIELSEIESVLLRVPGIAQAVVDTYEPEPGQLELVGYYTLRQDGEDLTGQDIRARLRDQLPGYMMPAYFERLGRIPMLPSHKADRKSLPKPSTVRTTGDDGDYVAPESETETILAEALAAVLRVERVSTTANFFSDLGANSMLLARLAGRLRKDGRVPVPAMQDLYITPTVRDLATALDATPTRSRAATPAAPAGRAPRVGAGQYVLCGALQLLFLVLSAFVSSLILLEGYLFVSAGDGALEVVGRSLVFGSLSFVGVCLMPVAAKWALIGRWTPREIPVWSLAYVRFWVIKTLIRSSPMRLFAGTPVYSLYLRALGANIGARTVILSSFVPVCTDLLTVGDHTVIRKDVSFACYRAHRGVIQIAPVTIGRDAMVGEGSIIDIGASLGDGAELGHASTLHTHQSVPAGNYWHGSPAQPAGPRRRALDAADCSARRRALYSIVIVANSMGLVSILGFGTLSYGLPRYLSWDHLNHSDPWFYADLLVLALALLLGGLTIALGVIATVPRLLNLTLKPNQVYPLYGWHYAAQRAIARMTNSAFLMELTGDSSLVVHYLRLLGYRQPELVQTGSNFGAALKHDNPYVVTIGSGTMVADGLSIVSADFSSSSFRISPTSIGARSYFGNNIIYPAGGRTGDNCLLATKVLVPVDGEARRDVGLLGSPSFEIPRTVRRDTVFNELATGEELRTRLHAKNWHNAVTIVLFLVSRWIYLFVALFFASFAVALHTVYDVFVVTGAFLVMLGFTVFYLVLLERLAFGFRRFTPLFCSIYDVRFWRHERYWKFNATAFLQLFNGTPFKGPIWRLLGVRVGRRLFDDGAHITEKTIVVVGDDCTLNNLSTVQAHSMEDGAFKLEAISVGDECTVGVNSYIHYGTRIGHGAVVEADSFLMKGTEIPPALTFGGNPARALVTTPLHDATRYAGT